MNKKKTRVIANIVVGKPDVKPEAPSHTRGVFQGNKPHLIRKGEMQDGERAEGSARRSTGIRPKDHEVIDPRMPKISPA
jgi:hypothetical protein